MQLPLAAQVGHLQWLRHKPPDVHPSEAKRYSDMEGVSLLVLRGKDEYADVEGVGPPSISGMQLNGLDKQGGAHIRGSVQCALAVRRGNSLTLGVHSSPAFSGLQSEPRQHSNSELQRRMLSASAAQPMLRHVRSLKTYDASTTQAAADYLRDSQRFYEDNVPCEAREEELQHFVATGGKLPVIRQDTPLPSHKCGAQLVVRDNDMHTTIALPSPRFATLNDGWVAQGLPSAFPSCLAT